MKNFILLEDGKTLVNVNSISMVSAVGVNPESTAINFIGAKGTMFIKESYQSVKQKLSCFISNDLEGNSQNE